MAEINGKKISDFRVVDLRVELEKRGLDKAGVKGVLVERLTQAMLKEIEGSGSKQDSELENAAENPVNTETTESSNDVVVQIEPTVVQVDDQSVNHSPNEGGDASPTTESVGDDSKGYEDHEGGGEDADESNTTTVTVDEAGGDHENATIDQEDVGMQDVGDDDQQDVDNAVDQIADTSMEEQDDDDMEQQEGVQTIEEENCETVEDDEEQVAADNEIIEDGDEEEIAAADDSAAVEGDIEGVNEECEEVEEQEDQCDEEQEEEEEEEETESIVIETEPVENENTTKSSSQVAFDDEMDQDALRLTIGEDEEEDKKFMLDEERERDKTEEEEDENDVQEGAVGSKSSKNNSQPSSATADNNKRVSKDTKTQVPATSKDSSKTQKSTPKGKGSKTTKDTTSAETITKSTTEVKEKTKETTTTPTSEQGVVATSSSATPKTTSASFKSKSQTGKDSKDSSKIVNKDSKASSTKVETTKKPSRIVVPPPASRPSRAFDKPRFLPSKRRSISPSKSRSIQYANRQALSFEHIRELRERERQRERELELRRREREMQWNRDTGHRRRMRDLERRNAEELALLEREREKLRLEREKVEREKQRIIRIMQEKTRAERDLIEKEKDALRRTQAAARVVVDEHSSRSQKRPYIEDEKARLRDYPERKKIAPSESRRFEHHLYDDPLVSSRGSTSSARVPVLDRPSYIRDSRDQRPRNHRSKSRSYSPVGRDSLHARSLRESGAVVAYGTREVDWERKRTNNRDSHQGGYDKDLKREPEIRRDRIPRDREILAPTSPSRRPAQTDYAITTARNEVYHRPAPMPVVKLRPSERYDVAKNVRQSDPTNYNSRDESWMKRSSSYTTSSGAQVQHQPLPSSSTSSRENWMTERKSDWPVADSRLTGRSGGAISSVSDRWVTGSGNAISTSGLRAGSGVPLVPPPPPIFHQHTSSSAASSYTTGRYTAAVYPKPTVIRRY